MKNVSTEIKLREATKLVIVFMLMLLANVLMSNIASRLVEAGVNIPFTALAIIGELAIMAPAIIYLIIKMPLISIILALNMQ